jgi:hypothetical protein
MRIRSAPSGFWTLFAGLTITCLAGARLAEAQSLNLSFQKVEYRDLDGDQDQFPDSGETGRLAFTITNNGAALGALSFILATKDPNVVCISSALVEVDHIAAGETIVVGNLGAAGPGFTLRVSDTLQSVLPGSPALISVGLWAVSADLPSYAGWNARLPADMNLQAGGTQTPTPGPDGVPGTADDGIILENFDVDRDGDGLFTVNDTFRTPAGEHGFYMRGGEAGGPGVLRGLACGGFQTPADGNPFCALDPDYPMDWHLHCAPGAANCPNEESGTCVGGCFFDTPANGQKAYSLPNSMHMGAHFDLNDHAAGDTTHFRALQAFVSGPINLAMYINSGAPPLLELSMRHIARLMDNYGTAPIGGYFCMDCADVQVQIDGDPDPAVDAWGAWDKLVPFENVYEHYAIAWSFFGSYYCAFTPDDATTAPPPAPPGTVVETMCHDFGVWSSCGSVNGTSPSSVNACTFPGDLDPSGHGVWATTKFHLDGYLGQRVRIRWIGESWDFGDDSSSYYELGAGWAPTQIDDGWWLDDITITGTATSQLTPTADLATPPGAPICPVDACNQSVGLLGANVQAVVTDSTGAPFDGSFIVPDAGQEILVDGSSTTLPGGCVGGVPEFRFFRDNILFRNWDAQPWVADSPEFLRMYGVSVRCSVDHSCTAPAQGPRWAPVRTTDGGDTSIGVPPNGVSFGVLYSKASGSPQTTLNLWTSSGLDAMDLYRGRIGPGTGSGSLAPGPAWIPGAGAPAGSAPACLRANLVGTGNSPGATIRLRLSALDDPDPPPGYVSYYLLTHNAPDGTSRNAMGCANPDVCLGGTSQGASCHSDTDCPGGGTCLNATLSASMPSSPFGCPPDGDPRKVLRQVDPSALCQ